MSNPAVELKITGDGSHTLFVPSMNENYHSYHGAYAEAVHVFIETGLKFASKKFSPVEIFEVGFGTGLNAVLSYQWAQQNSHLVHYTGIEKHPLTNDILAQLNYTHYWKDANLDSAFLHMHADLWNESTILHECFKFKKINKSLLEFQLPSNNFHVIFFDAFAPEKQPEMWTVDIFKKLYDSLLPGGMLVTYCAKGQFKRDLKAAGFFVETLPGPPGKREMVRGLK